MSSPLEEADDAAAIDQLMDQYPDGADLLWKALNEPEGEDHHD